MCRRSLSNNWLYLLEYLRSVFVIAFLDGEKIEVDATGFSVAKVLAAHKRLLAGAKSHTELTADDKVSNLETKIARGLKI